MPSGGTPRIEHDCYTSTMPSELVILDSADVLEDVIATSEERLVLLFKHSVTCGTSAQAYDELVEHLSTCLLYTSPSPRDRTRSRMPSSA